MSPGYCTIYETQMLQRLGSAAKSFSQDMKWTSGRGSGTPDKTINTKMKPPKP